MQQWYSLSDSVIEDALIEVPTMQMLAGMKVISEQTPDQTTILASWHLLEKHDFGEQTFLTIKAHLKEKSRS